MTEPEHVLVVDDEASMQRSVQRVLASRYDVTAVGSGRAALDALRERPADLAVLDIRMPDLDGFELLTALRAVQPDLEAIFMTGAISEIDAQIVRSIRERAFYFITKPFDRDVLLTLVERCLELRRLARDNRRHVARLERELDAARRFQQSLLPARSARIGSIALAASYAPCDELGGDLFDYVDAGAGRVAGLVADVSGHGVSAAMLTAIVKAAFHDAGGPVQAGGSEDDEGFAPGAVAARIARGLATFDDDRFVTLFAFLLDPSRGRLDYVNAGHPAAWLWNGAAQRQELPLTAPMISPAFPDLERPTHRLEVAPRGRLFVYTDGIVEARRGDDLYGDDRLATALGTPLATPLATPPATSASASGPELVAGVLADVAQFTRGAPPDDDRTLLCADWS